MLSTLGLIVLLWVLLIGYQTWRAGSALNDVRDQARQLTTDLNAGDLTSARQVAAQIQGSAHSAASQTSGPWWSAAAALPWIGDDAGAIRTSAQAIDAIAGRSLPTLLDLAGQVMHGQLRPRGGRVDLAAVRRLAPSVAAAAAAVDGPARDVAAISANHLIFPLSSVVGELQTNVHEAQIAIDATADAFKVLPTMLGENGPRRYLLVVQNNSEIRSTGGLAGSWAILNARGGKLSMGRQGDATMFANGQNRVRPTAEEAALFGRAYGSDPRDININPDFSRVAKIYAGMAAAHGVHIDGVFAVDPVALADVLQGTGPISLPSGQLNAGNAVQFLLNQVYETVTDPGTQNSFYAMAARRTFDALVHGQGNQVLAIRGLVVAASQRRVLAWSPIPEVDAIIGRNKLSGALPLDTGATPQVGLFLDDGVAGKIDYFLRYDSTATSLGCRGGRQRIQIDTTLRSTVTPEVAGSSPWVVGFGNFAPKGDILLQLMVYGPWRGSVDQVLVDGQDQTSDAGTQEGRPVTFASVDLRPGQVARVRTIVTSGVGQTGGVQVTQTPGLDPVQDPQTFGSGC